MRKMKLWDKNYKKSWKFAIWAAYGDRKRKKKKRKAAK